MFFFKFHTNVLTLPAFTFFLTGLLDMLGHDDLDFTAIMGKVLEEAEPKEAGKKRSRINLSFWETAHLPLP